jgi:HlyD family secretion protein
LQVRGDVQAAGASSEAARAAYERAQQLNADNKNISDRALQEAQSRWATEQARLTAAKGILAVIESSLQSAEAQTFVALTVEKPGEVTEVMALPGEEVTAGTPLLRLVRFDRLLARIELPVGQSIPSKPASARIVPVGREELSIPAEPVAVSASVDPQTQAQSLLFRLTGNPARLRPGLAVTAYLSIPGSLHRVAVVPSSAVVQHAGASFVYVRTSEEEFVRRPLSDLRPARGGYVVEEGLTSGEEVVTQGAQLLLSEELKSFISVGEDE